MGTEVDVFISNYALVDPEIYQLWVEGYSASEIVSVLNQRGLGQITGASLELIASDVLDHIRTYSMLEKLLVDPNKLQDQLAFQMDPQTRLQLIEKYYDFDDVVVRELIGRKMSGKHRKELEDVSERTGIPIKCCKRQFENVKRVIKTVEEMPGSVIQNIQNTFYLSEQLSRRYAVVVFLASIRFETSKKTHKLANYSFACYKRCIEAILDHWTAKLIGPDNVEPDFYMDFFTKLREVKVLIDKDVEHKNLVCLSLKPTLLQRNYQDLDSNFKAYTKAFAIVACTMAKPRDIRNLLMELSILSESLKQANWTVQDVEMFLTVYTQCSVDFEGLRESESVKVAFGKYMKVATECLLAIYRE